MTESDIKVGDVVKITQKYVLYGLDHNISPETKYIVIDVYKPTYEVLHEGKMVVTVLDDDCRPHELWGRWVVKEG